MNPARPATFPRPLRTLAFAALFAFAGANSAFSESDMKHPFLDDSFEIRWSQFSAADVVPDIDLALAEAQEAVDRIAAIQPEVPVTRTLPCTGAATTAGRGVDNRQTARS
jgi:hypothetical protein